MERAHRKFVAVSLVGSELPTKVVERIEGMPVVKAFLVFPVAAFCGCSVFHVRCVSANGQT